MKIQEMRPGVLQLNRRLAAEKKEELFDFFVSSEKAEDEPTELAAPLILSELEQPRWSVVSFDRREASGLSYRQASALMDDLNARGIAGLCVITDDAADRVKS